jgi:SAM-dependent methyltransferase
MRLEPRPAPQELREYYPREYWFAPDGTAAGTLEEAWRRLVLRDHVTFVLQALARSRVRGPVLDVGCGGGLFLGMLAERGIRGVGLDFSADAAAVAWNRQGVPAVCGDLIRAPVAEASCAVVTMFHVLEHLHDPAAYVETARRLLRPGGRLIVQVPNAASWQARLLGRAWSGFDVPRHLVHFRARDLEALVERCGFRVERLKHFSLRDNPAGLASSLFPRLDPMARRVRHTGETPATKLAKDLLYLGVLAAGLPFASLEAAFGAGSTIMLDARLA